MTAALLVGLSGCETLQETGSVPLPPRPAAPAIQGSYHSVQRGETLWRIARSYGLEVTALARANRLRDASVLRVGQNLFIPVPAESRAFFWPARGRVGRSGSNGVSIAAAPGSLVRASRSGRVAVATNRLSGWGKAVVLDHLDGYLTVYAGLEQILTAPGASLRQGVPLGSLGARALHFEIRYGTAPKDTLALLPGD